jgi:hypothetical protein
MGIQLKNNAVGYLATAITASDTGAVLQTGNGARFPTLGVADYFYATLESTGGTMEVVKVTARSGDSITIARAQEGTTAQSFAAGSRFELRVTAQSVIDVAGVFDAYVTEFGADPSGVADSTLAIQTAVNSGRRAVVPAGTFKVTDSIVVGASRALHLEQNATIYGVMSSPRPVVRVSGNFASLTGTGFPTIRCDHQTGGLLRSFDEGVVQVGPATYGGGANINWARVDGIRVLGNNTLYDQYNTGVNTDIDKYIGIKCVHGRYTAPGSTSTSLYNSTIANCMIEAVGVGIDLDPVVQGNNFINNYFYKVSFAGYRARGCGENTFTQGFYHFSRGVSFFRFETVPLRIDGAVGVFTAGEVVTGSTSGATLTLYPSFPYDQTEGALYGVASGTFVVGETVTGASSGATAIVSTTRQVYIGGVLGRNCQGNSCINIIGEPGPTALIGTQNAGPIGGRFSRFYTVLDGNNGNVFQGRANTGHGVINYGTANVQIEQGAILSQRDATFAAVTGTVSGAFPVLSVGSSPLESSVKLLDLNTVKKHYACSDNLTSAQKTRFTFQCPVLTARRGALIKISVLGQWTASNTDNNYPAAIYVCRTLTNSFGNTVIDGPTALYEYVYSAGSHFTFTSGAGTREFTIDIANPTGDSTVEFFYEVEILGRDIDLLGVTTV